MSIAKVVAPDVKPGNHVTLALSAFYTHHQILPSHDWDGRASVSNACGCSQTAAGPISNLFFFFWFCFFSLFQIKAWRGQKVNTRLTAILHFNSFRSLRRPHGVGSLSFTAALLWPQLCSSTCDTPASSSETPRSSSAWARRRTSGWLFENPKR